MTLRRIIRGVRRRAQGEMAQKPNPQGGSRGKIDEKKMEGMEAQSSSTLAYVLKPSQLFNEDILFCIDVDAESMVEMKVTGSKGRPITRMDSIKQAILLFVHSKLAINSDHRFAFAALGKTASWVFVSLSPFFIFSKLTLGFFFLFERFTSALLIFGN